VPLFITGKLTPDSVIAQGTAPHTGGYVDAPGATTFAAGETGWFTMVPTIYNADALGIRPDLVGKRPEAFVLLRREEPRRDPVRVVERAHRLDVDAQFDVAADRDERELVGMRHVESERAVKPSCQ